MAMSAEDWDDLAEMYAVGGSEAHKQRGTAYREPVYQVMWAQASVLFAMAAYARKMRNKRRER